MFDLKDVWKKEGFFFSVSEVRSSFSRGVLNLQLLDKKVKGC